MFLACKRPVLSGKKLVNNEINTESNMESPPLCCTLRLHTVSVTVAPQSWYLPSGCDAESLWGHWGHRLTPSGSGLFPSAQTFWLMWVSNEVKRRLGLELQSESDLHRSDEAQWGAVRSGSSQRSGCWSDCFGCECDACSAPCCRDAALLHCCVDQRPDSI